jgi:hypothetical protein
MPTKPKTKPKRRTSGTYVRQRIEQASKEFGWDPAAVEKLISETAAKGQKR